MRIPSWINPRIYLVPTSSREGVFDEEEHLKLHFCLQIGHSANFKKKKSWKILLNYCPMLRKQSSVFRQSARCLIEFNSTIYLSKLTDITVSSIGASRKVHAPQLWRSYDGWKGILTSLLLLFQKHLENRFNKCETSQNLLLPPDKGKLDPQVWSPAIILRTLQWGEVIANLNISSSRCAVSARQRWAPQIIYLWDCLLLPDSYASGIKIYFPH